MEGYRTRASKLIGRLLRNRSGQDMIEYALMAAFLAVAVAAFFPTSIAPNVSSVFSRIVSVLVQVN